MTLRLTMRFLQVSFAIFCICFLFSFDIFSQTKKPAAKTNKSSEKSQTANSKGKTTKDIKSTKTETASSKNKTSKPQESKSNKKTDTAKNNSKDSKSSKPAAELKAAREQAAREAARIAAARQAEEVKRLAEIRRIQEERRQAALAEQRRREQARREAIARQIAFERGLRTETVENILQDKTDGEDLQIRRVAVEALGNRAGTAVVMEAETGKVLTIVNQDWAIKKGFKPCSTIKLVTGTAGVNEDLINESGNLKNQYFRMNLDDALAYSNNTYFQKVGVNLGKEKMISYARTLGLGERTGINADDEFSGKLPYNNGNARIYSHGDDFEVTPLQLAVMVTAISNGGKVIVPQIQKKQIEKAKFNPKVRQQAKIPQETFQNLIPGMLGATEYGTAKRAATYGLNVAGKTGSCIFDNTWIGLFASVAPAINPKYAVVVITRGQSERGKYASAVAGKIYQALAPRFDKSDRQIIAKIPSDLKPEHKTNAQASAQMDNDEGEDSDDGDIVKANVNNPKKGLEREDAAVQMPQSSSAPVKETPRVVKTVKSNPKAVFNPVIIQFNRDGAETGKKSAQTNSRPRVVKN